MPIPHDPDLRIIVHLLSGRRSAIAVFLFSHIYVIVRLSCFEGQNHVLHLFVFSTVPNKYVNYRINPKSVGFPSSFHMKNVDSSCIVEVSPSSPQQLHLTVGTMRIGKKEAGYFKVVTWLDFTWPLSSSFHTLPNGSPPLVYCRCGSPSPAASTWPPRAWDRVGDCYSP